jgi:hypothetical protein
VQDPEAQDEDPDRPPWVLAANRDQRLDRPECRREDPDEATVPPAGEQREPAGELNDPDDDPDPFRPANDTPGSPSVSTAQG